MNQLVSLDGEMQERLVRAIQSSVNVRRRHELFLWARGQFFILMPHEILICLRLQRGNGATQVETVHCSLFDEKQESMLFHPHRGLAVRLALSCEASGCLPSLIAADAPRHAKIYEQFRDDLNQAGLRNAVVHGDRVSADSDACFFILFNVAEEVTPTHGHLMQLLHPHLQLAFNHVVSQDGDCDSEVIEVAPPASITGRELQVLQWICSGKSNYEIGVILNVSPLTVKNHVQKIFRKFNVHNRAQAVSRAMSLNLFHEPS